MWKADSKSATSAFRKTSRRVNMHVRTHTYMLTFTKACKMRVFSILFSQHTQHSSHFSWNPAQGLLCLHWWKATAVQYQWLTDQILSANYVCVCFTKHNRTNRLNVYTSIAQKYRAVLSLHFSLWTWVMNECESVCVSRSDLIPKMCVHYESKPPFLSLFLSLWNNTGCMWQVFRELLLLFFLLLLFHQWAKAPQWMIPAWKTARQSPKCLCVHVCAGTHTSPYSIQYNICCCFLKYDLWVFFRFAPLPHTCHNPSLSHHQVYIVHPSSMVYHLHVVSNNPHLYVITSYYTVEADSLGIHYCIESLLLLHTVWACCECVRVQWQAGRWQRERIY